MAAAVNVLPSVLAVPLFTVMKCSCLNMYMHTYMARVPFITHVQLRRAHLSQALPRSQRLTYHFCSLKPKYCSLRSL